MGARSIPTKLVLFGMLPGSATCVFGCNSALISLLPETAEAGASDGAAAPHLVGQWTLDVDGTDAIGGNNGALLGTTSFAKDATRGDVLSCNGVDSAVRISNTTGPSFTYAAWIWSDTPSKRGIVAVDGDALIWSNLTPALDDFTLAVLNDRIAYLGYAQSTIGATILTDAKWHHVGVTRQDGEKITLYVDGRVDAEGNAGAGAVSANPFVYLCGGDIAGHYFKGKMDDVRQYDRVLSVDEVRTLFGAPP